MKRFYVDDAVFDALPGYCLGVVVAKGIRNEEHNEAITTQMDEEMDAFHQQFEGINLKEYPGICAYRDAFHKLNMNPNKFMCSIEAMAKRVQKGNRLPHINPVVDVGNALSLKYVLPLGAHDIDQLEEDGMAIRFSTPEDHFLPIGETEQEIMPEGELVYVSGHTVKTRRWIWRQSDDGKITGDTSYVLFPIDAFEGINDAQVVVARDELAAILREQFGCEVKTAYLNRENPSVDL
ncbi:MAG: hypothetical protein LUC99_05390 [Clostridiales bacterium]|nr:hypothetical protein [Clostridiales bacterium]